VLRAPAQGESRDALRAEAAEHFAKISAELPFWKRIKILHFWEGALPKTATRKVKRAAVLAELVRLERAAASGAKAGATASAGAGSDAWLFELLAELGQRPLGSVHAQSRLVADLGFDSLLVAELAVALEKAGVRAPDEARLSSLTTAGDLAKAIAEQAGAPSAAALAVRGGREPESDGVKKSGEPELPATVARAGRGAIGLFQHALYRGVFDLSVEGKANIPRSASFLVAANHQSHLDVGLVKMALGDEGPKLASLAARDYFFDTPWKRAWFGSFTNLVPLDRRGSLKESLQTAVRTLELGYHLLIFPEGTRSLNGELQEFKPAIAYLSFAANADILPVYLEGTHQAMPKGSFLPDPRRRRKLSVRIGPPLRVAELRAATSGLSRSAAHREVTRLVRLAVEALRDRKPPPRIDSRAEILAAQLSSAAPGED
jgi:long-chain acyl-CoA synthetase